MILTIIGFIVKVLGVFIGIGIPFMYVYGLIKLKKIECEIFDQQDLIDNIEQDQKSKSILHSGMVSQGQFERMTEVRLKPMEAKLNKLKLERQFLLDKIPLVGWFKR